MRSLGLAQAWQARGWAAAFLSHSSPALRRRVESAGVACAPLAAPHPDPRDLETTLACLGDLAAGGRAVWLVLDGYHFDPAYQAGVRTAGHRLLVLDDTGHLPAYHADVLVNPGIHAERLDYRCLPETLLLLGGRFAPLRPEYLARRDRERPVRDAARRLLVTLGGADPDNATLGVIEALRQVEIDGLEAVVVAGPDNPHGDALARAAGVLPIPVRLVRGAHDMADLMAWADLAVSAGGSTCWELMFMGVPTVTVVLAANQEAVAAGLDEAGAVVNAGWLDQATPAKLAHLLGALAADRRRREELSRSARALVDGRGVERIAAVVRALEGRPLDDDGLTLRRATPRDAVPIWRLANDPSVRMNSFNPDPIPLAHHLAWYGQKLGAHESRLWVLELAGVVVGQVRYDRVDAETAEIHFAVSAAFRGKGLGTEMLRRTWHQAGEGLAVRRIRGWVLSENPGSGRAFLKAGFTRVGKVERRGRACEVFERERG